MKHLNLFLFCLVAVSLACSVQVSGSDSIPTPTSAPTATRLQAVIPTTTSLVAVTISQAVVTVRQSPGGEATGKYVRSGERVQIIKCTGDWCRIKKPGGWIFRGCIQELADGLLCMAKP
jgi:hypothetical protein